MSKGKDLINSIKYGLYRMLTQKYGVYGNFLYMDYVCFYRFYRKNLFPVLFLFFLRIMGGMTDSSSPPNPFQRAAKNSLFFGSSTQAEAKGQAEVRE